MANKKKNSKANTSNAPSWSKADDSKLRTLFTRGIRIGGLDPDDLGLKTVEGVYKRFWSDRVLDSFKPLYRRKVCKFNLNTELEGGRKMQGKGK